MKLILVLSWVIFSTVPLLGQENVAMTGKVLDAKTNLPLVSASVGLKEHPYSTATDEHGNFTFLFPDKFLGDSLFVSYVGYRAFTDKLSNVELTNATFSLNESATLLDEVTILEKRLYRFEIRRLESSLKQIKDNLYAQSTEVTNKEYNQFLGYLIKSGQMSLYRKYKPDISGYKGTMLTFFKGYHLLHSDSKESKYDTDYDNYPVVNITYEAAVAYCEWFSDLYNTTKGKKKFSEVKFKLPGIKEWQIAALGYKKFQSWDLDENIVEVGIPRHPGEEVAIKWRPIPVKGNDILYPWYTVYNYRNKAQNIRNCWIGNFKIPVGSTICPAMQPAGDGFPMTGRTGAYFPNGMGLFDVVGNVAEMIDEKGKACGGSWDHDPKESTITSINPYSGTSGAVGFRVFMEALDENNSRK
jgi:CarboxypepD_reg-like domain/Sulfatase-modifying factor enzyme 1